MGVCVFACEKEREREKRENYMYVYIFQRLRVLHRWN